MGGHKGVVATAEGGCRVDSTSIYCASSEHCDAGTLISAQDSNRIYAGTVSAHAAQYQTG